MKKKKEDDHKISNLSDVVSTHFEKRKKQRDTFHAIIRYLNFASL